MVEITIYLYFFGADLLSKALMKKRRRSILAFLTFNFPIWHIHVSYRNATHWITAATLPARSDDRSESGREQFGTACVPVRFRCWATNAPIRTCVSRANRLTGNLLERRERTSGAFSLHFRTHGCSDL
jgi:hypothetical protein